MLLIPPQEPEAHDDRREIHIVEYTGKPVDRTIFAIRETSLHIFINDLPLVRLACTGKYPAYLAVGFLFSCGVIESAADIDGLDIVNNGEEGLEARLRLNRNLALPTRTVTSGLGSTFQMPKANIAPLPPAAPDFFEAETIMRLSGELEERANLYHITRGCHNSSLCSNDTMLLYREDIGRHNAIDTLVGQCLLEERDTSSIMILSTGRIASEIVQKVVRARIPVLASTAAATSIAVENARAFGLTLMGKTSPKGMWIYNNTGCLRMN